ncbi:MAG: hypothetical protein H6871_05935 [Methylobacteriaceae bacterium]|nr:hypothetical protein [Methylobacteriaceae bacterium]
MPKELISRLEKFVTLTEADRRAVDSTFRHRRTTSAGRDVIQELGHADGVVVITEGLPGSSGSGMTGGVRSSPSFIPAI